MRSDHLPRLRRLIQWTGFGGFVDDEEAAAPTLHATLAHLQTFWDRRQELNVALFHYGDLCADLGGQLRWLADVLSSTLSEERVEELAAAASFDRMKDRATELAPCRDQGFWRSTENFFHTGPVASGTACSMTTSWIATTNASLGSLRPIWRRGRIRDGSRLRRDKAPMIIRTLSLIP